MKMNVFGTKDFSSGAKMNVFEVNECSSETKKIVLAAKTLKTASGAKKIVG